MRCYSHLSDDERKQIGSLKALGHSIGAIAQAIGRPKSTISRELSRNRLPSGDRERQSLTDLRSRPPRGRLDARANLRLAEGRSRPQVATSAKSSVSWNGGAVEGKLSH
jgi:IS30 family transposase